MPDFKSLNLAAPIFRAIEELGYTTPTPIQEKAIPDVLTGQDLMGIAQTGTGKTAAFSLPLLNHICANDKEPPRKGSRALILAPTRELASQIAESLRDYGQHIPFLSVAVIFGGVPIPRQIKKLSGGNDIIVATPGRLIDLLDRRAVNLSDIEFLILDEADQMLDMGFIHALKKIIPLLPKKRQTLFFSATMVPAIKKLAGQFLTNPITVSVTPPNSTAEKVEQRISFVNKSEKQNLLGLSLLEPDVERALVFTRTKHGADRVVKRLARIGIAAMAIHGNKSQSQRQRALLAFRESQINVLVATDVAARGIDIPGITHVFNFEIPNVPEQYVHRIGRTARANRSGIAHAFVDKEERGYLKDIQKLLQTEIPVVPLPEDFVGKSSELNKRKPIELPSPPKQDARKGRGKSKKKARFAKDKKKAPQETQSKRKEAKSSKPPAQAEKAQTGKAQSEKRQTKTAQTKKPNKKPSWGHHGQESERRRKTPTQRTESQKTKPSEAFLDNKTKLKNKRRQPSKAKPRPQSSAGIGKSGVGKSSAGKSRSDKANDGNTSRSPHRYGKRANKGGNKPKNTGRRPDATKNKN